MTRRIAENKITFIVAERDIDSPFRATGAIIFEQMTNETPVTVMKRARKLGDRYGRLWIAQISEEDLVPVDEFEYAADGDFHEAPPVPEDM